MYSLPDFNNFQPSYNRYTYGETGFAGPSVQYPPPSSSPFLTLGSGFYEGFGVRKAPCEQNYWQYSQQKKRTGSFIRDPDIYKFSCDACSRSYISQEELDRHIAEHVKCTYEGCSFRGNAKLIRLHEKMQHHTGLATMISKLNTPEEIKKWREERRRNFPTAANVKKRQEEQAEKRARGEIFETKHFRKRKRPTRNCYHKRKSTNFRDRDDVEKSSFFEKHQNNRTKPTFVNRRQRKRKAQKFNNNTKKNSTHFSKYNNERVKFPQQSNHQLFDYIIQKYGISVERTQNVDILVKFPGTKALEISDEINKEGSDSTLKLDEHQENLQQQCNSNDYSCAETESIKQNPVTNPDEISFNISDSEVEEAHVASISQPLNDTVNKGTSQVDSRICEPQSSDECNEDNVVTDGDATTLLFFTADKEIEDTDEESPVLQPIVKIEPSTELPLQTKVGGALGNLMAAYGSESESENKDEPVAKQVKEQHFEKKDNSNARPAPSFPKISHCRITLLEKLLANEIRHERNVVFQCINYIVKNNFFEKSD